MICRDCDRREAICQNDVSILLRFGKSAGLKRNAEMAAYANALNAFWDGESKGTKFMIELATQAGLKADVVYF